MLRTTLRMLFTVSMTLSLTLGVFSGVGTSLASAASSQPAAASGYIPLGSVPAGVGYCYPSGYNKAGWRCGWRLAQAPYNLGTYYNNYNYYGYYNGYYNSGYGGRGPYGYMADYGGKPRYGNYYYNSCYYSYSPYCY